MHSTPPGEAPQAAVASHPMHSLASESSELFEIHSALQEAGKRLNEAREAAQMLGTSQKSEAGYLVDFARRFEEQVLEAHSRVELLGAALDRIKIVALNTGLEGARLGDLAGKVLVGVADELRQLTARGLELLLEQTSALEQLEKERLRLRDVTERNQKHLTLLDNLEQSCKEAEAGATIATLRLSQALERSTGLDGEAQARVVQTAERARELAALLAKFDKPAQRQVARQALLLELEPLLLFLSQDKTVAP